MRVAVLLTIAFLSPAWCRAEDEKPPAQTTTKKTSRPSAPSAADVEQQQAALTAARTFVHHVIDGNEIDKAYALTSAAYQKDHSAEQFADDAKAAREAAVHTSAPGLQGFVSLKPKGGGPPVAMLGTVPRPTPDPAAPAPQTEQNIIVIELAREPETGLWHVTAFRAVDMRSTPGVPFWQELQKNDKTARPVSTALSGEVAAVERGSFTVKIKGRTKPGEPRKFTVDDKTLVTVLEAFELYGGVPPARAYKPTPGSLDDLEAAANVTIEPSLDGKSARSIQIKRDKPRNQKEGL
jgi:hypothetical protein